MKISLSFSSSMIPMALAPLTTKSSLISCSEKQECHSSNRIGTNNLPPLGPNKCHTVESESKYLLPNLNIYSPQPFIQSIRDKVKARGARGIIGLGKVFSIMDDNGSKSLDFPEFSKGMRDYKIDIPEDQLQVVFNAFDVNRDGTISYDEFLRNIRGDLNPQRLQLVRRAFTKLDRDGSGVVDINDIRGVYNGQRHPDVLSGKKTEDQVLVEFLETFETHHSVRNGT